MNDVSVDTRVCAASALMNPERVVDDAKLVAYSVDELVLSLPALVSSRVSLSESAGIGLRVL